MNISDIKKKFHYATIVLTAIVGVTICGCTSHPHYKNSEEALKGCNKELKKLYNKKDCSIKDLTNYTNDWLEIQDSAYATFSRDSALGIHSPIATAYFMVSDSIRNQLSRLALSKPRSLHDVMYLRLYSAKDRDKITENDSYKEFTDLFEKLDKKDVYPNKVLAVDAYMNLLKNAKPFKNETDITEFIIQEDKCFRSIMTFLSAIPQEQLNYLTRRTNILFNSLYSVVGKHSDQMNDRIMLLLTMRVNRRIIQNCIACRNDILDNKRLDKTQKANYRWMLIQPFMTLDEYSAAVMTEKQRKDLLEISNDIPELITRVEDKNNSNPEMLSKVLSEYFLKSYLTNL